MDSRYQEPEELRAGSTTHWTLRVLVHPPSRWSWLVPPLAFPSGGVKARAETDPKEVSKRL